VSDVNENWLNVNENDLNASERARASDRVVVVVFVFLWGNLTTVFDAANNKTESNRWVNCFTQLCTR
jgi:hypothetical protein